MKARAAQSLRSLRVLHNLSITSPGPTRSVRAMTRVLTERFLTRYAAANYNQASRGVNGSDHMVMVSVTPVDRSGRGAGLVASPANAVLRNPAAMDPEVAEGYSSAAGLGLVLLTASAGGAAAGVLVIMRLITGVFG